MTVSAQLNQNNAQQDIALSEVEILSFQEEYSDHFKTLNLAWIERFFKVEAEDERVLSNPQTHIIAHGGQVLFAKLEGEIVGTCALIPHGDEVFELAKMAVDPKAQGKKIGRKLLEAAIETSRKLGKKYVDLETNSSLTAAVTLYEKLGFKHIPVPPDSKFSRADVAMRLELS